MWSSYPPVTGCVNGTHSCMLGWLGLSALQHVCRYKLAASLKDVKDDELKDFGIRNEADRRAIKAIINVDHTGNPEVGQVVLTGLWSCRHVSVLPCYPDVHPMRH
jgi:hypothetical protein